MTGSRIALAIGATVAALTGAATVVAADGLQWYQGQPPALSRSGSTVTASGQVAGAGQVVAAGLGVRYSYRVDCYNPSGDIGPAPGRSQSRSASAPPRIVAASHGYARFTLQVTVPPPTAPTSACPSPGWRAVAGPPVISAATVTVTSDNGGRLSYTRTF